MFPCLGSERFCLPGVVVGLRYIKLEYFHSGYDYCYYLDWSFS